MEGDGIHKVEQRIIDFDNMDNFQNDFKDVHKVRKLCETKLPLLSIKIISLNVQKLLVLNQPIKTQ